MESFIHFILAKKLHKLWNVSKSTQISVFPPTPFADCLLRPSCFSQQCASQFDVPLRPNPAFFSPNNFDIPNTNELMPGKAREFSSTGCEAKATAPHCCQKSSKVPIPSLG